MQSYLPSHHCMKITLQRHRSTVSKHSHGALTSETLAWVNPHELNNKFKFLLLVCPGTNHNLSSSMTKKQKPINQSQPLMRHEPEQWASLHFCVYSSSIMYFSSKLCWQLHFKPLLTLLDQWGAIAKKKKKNINRNYSLLIIVNKKMYFILKDWKKKLLSVKKKMNLSFMA